MNPHFLCRIAATAAVCLSLIGALGSAASARPDTQDGEAGSGDVRASATFQLIARHSGRCLTPATGATGDGVAVIQASCNGSPAQRWYTVAVAAGWYEVRNAASNKCLDLYGGLNADAISTIMYTCYGAPWQRWQIHNRGDGFSEFRAYPTNRCLDVAYGSHWDGIPVYQWGCHGGGNQQWRFA